MMEMLSVGTLRDAVRQAGMRSKVELKKRSGTLQSHTAPEGLPARKTAEASIYQQMVNEERDDAKKDDGSRLSEIMDKIYAGKKLTNDEREYLRVKDPETYHRLKSVEAEQKSYEQELKRCRTKEEAQRLKMQHLNSALTTVKSVENNPNIPEGKKLAILRLEQVRAEKIEKTLKKFVRSGRYEKLPTEAEYAEAERAIREADEIERSAAEQRSDGCNEAAEKTTPEETAPEETGSKEMTPEERKVRQARQYAAFAASWSGEENDPPVISVQA